MMEFTYDKSYCDTLQNQYMDSFRGEGLDSLRLEQIIRDSILDLVEKMAYLKRHDYENPHISEEDIYVHSSFITRDICKMIYVVSNQ